MKIENYTNWDTKSIAKLFREVARREKYHKSKGLHLVIRNGGSENWCAGRGGLNYRYISVKLHPKSVNPIDLAFTFAHEMQHNYGARDKWLYKSPKYGGTKREEFFGWAKDYPILPKLIIPKVKTDFQIVRYGRAKSNLIKALTRFKRATSILKRWKSKVKYYEVVLARANKLPR